MSTQVHRFTHPFELIFWISTEELINAQVHELVFVLADQEPIEFRLISEVSWADYQEILETESFHLTQTVQGDAEDLSFNESRPIEIELKLDDALVPNLFHQGNSLEAVIQYLASVNQSNNHAEILAAKNWYALNVKQIVDLPPDLQNTGELKIGYQTTWVTDYENGVTSTSETSSIKEVGEEQPILKVMTEVLTQSGNPMYQWENDTVISFPYKGKNGQWRCYADARDQMFLCCFYSIFPELVPQEKRIAVAELLIRINYTLTVGNFEMDFADGEVRFRTSIDVEGDRLSEALFRRLTIANVTMMDRYLPEITRVIND